MNDSTKDSQELIEDLGKAGGGLSSGRAFFLRYLGFPLLNSIISWERALDIFEKEGKKVDNIYLENRHEHPWFGELKAKDWSVMGAIHQVVHRRQIEAIIRGV